MASIVALEPNEDYYVIEQQFDDTQYRLTLKWNERAQLWFLDLHLLNGYAVQLGTPITLRTFLTRFCRDAAAPKGDLIAIEQDNSLAEPGQRDFGSRVLLYYLTAADILALSEAEA